MSDIVEQGMSGLREVPRLQDVLSWHRWYRDEVNPPAGRCSCHWLDDRVEEPRVFRNVAEHEAHQADAWREACMIRNVAELDALPVGSVIRCGDDILIRSDQYLGGLCWRYNPDSDPMLLIDDDLPALLLWTPEWSEE